MPREDFPGLESSRQCRGHRFDPRSRKIPREAPEGETRTPQREGSPRIATKTQHNQNPHTATRGRPTHRNKDPAQPKPTHRNEREAHASQQRPSTTKTHTPQQEGGPRIATKTQHNQNFRKNRRAFSAQAAPRGQGDVTGALRFLGHRLPDSRKPPEAPEERRHIIRDLGSPPAGDSQEPTDLDYNGKPSSRSCPGPPGAPPRTQVLLVPGPSLQLRAEWGWGVGFKVPRNKGKGRQGDGWKVFLPKVQPAGHTMRGSARGRGSTGPLPAVPLAGQPPASEHSSSLPSSCLLLPWSRPCPLGRPPL